MYITFKTLALAREKKYALIPCKILHAHVIIYAIQTKFEKLTISEFFWPNKFYGQIGRSKPTERVQRVLDDHLWRDSRSLNVSGIWSNTSQDTDRCF